MVLCEQVEGGEGMKTIEQIALETAQEMGLIANSVYEAFAKQFLAAWLAQHEPVAWISNESIYRLKHGGNSKGTVPVHLMRSGVSNIPLFLAPPPAVQQKQAGHGVYEQARQARQAGQDAWRRD